MDAEAELTRVCGFFDDGRHIVAIFPLGKLLLEIQIGHGDRRLRVKQGGQTDEK